MREQRFNSKSVNYIFPDIFVVAMLLRSRCALQLMCVVLLIFFFILSFFLSYVSKGHAAVPGRYEMYWLSGLLKMGPVLLPD